MTIQEIRQRRKQWALRKTIIIEAINNVKCPWRVMRQSGEAISGLEDVVTRIREWQKELEANDAR